MNRVLPQLCVVIFLCACGSTNQPDGGGSDASYSGSSDGGPGGTDAGWTQDAGHDGGGNGGTDSGWTQDAGVDGGGPASRGDAGYCHPCNLSTDCAGAHDTCLQDMNGAFYCASDCSDGGLCPDGGICGAYTDNAGNILGLACQPAAGQCTNCVSFGQHCTTNADCCDGVYCQLVSVNSASQMLCADIGSGTATCKEPGSSCSNDVDCCPGENCHDGACAQGTSSCETPCTTGADCSCGLYGCLSGVCTLGLTCSSADAGGCFTDLDCCKGSLCSLGECAPLSCHALGQPCGSTGVNYPCCKGLSCVQQTCTESDGGVCGGLNQGCADGTVCCPNLSCDGQHCV